MAKNLTAEEAAERAAFSARFKELRKEVGLSLVEFGRLLGESKGTVSKYENGALSPDPGALRLVRIARALNVNLLWLAAGVGPKRGGTPGVDTIPIYDISLIQEGIALEDGAQKIGDMPVDIDLLRRIGHVDAGGLVAFDNAGDSMAPTIADGARVVADRGDTRLREGIFAFQIGGDVRVKRLRRLADGVEILSDNPRYAPERLTSAEMAALTIIGRVQLGVTTF